MTKVLVADDDAILAESLVELLGAAGFDACAVTAAADLAARLRAEAPDALVQDARMPGLDLEQWLRSIRADPALARTAVVLHTGSASLAAFRRTLPVDAAVEKPATPAALVAVLDDVLRIRRGRRLLAEGEAARPTRT